MRRIEGIQERAKGRSQRSNAVSPIGRQQRHGSRSRLACHVMRELEARFVGRVEIIYQQNHWALCCQPQKERHRSIEERPLFSLWIAHPQPLEMGNGVLLRRTLVLG